MTATFVTTRIDAILICHKPIIYSCKKVTMSSKIYTNWLTIMSIISKWRSSYFTIFTREYFFMNFWAIFWYCNDKQQEGKRPATPVFTWLSLLTLKGKVNVLYAFEVTTYGCHATILLQISKPFSLFISFSF